MPATMTEKQGHLVQPAPHDHTGGSADSSSLRNKLSIKITHNTQEIPSGRQAHCLFKRTPESGSAIQQLLLRSSASGPGQLIAVENVSMDACNWEADLQHTARQVRNGTDVL